jgi:tetratricopeptide (TPR) repeat protein
LRAAIWSVYHAPRPEVAPLTPETTGEDSTPEESPSPPEEELQPGKPLAVVEEYSIPAPPEVLPEPEKPFSSARKRIRKVKSFRRSEETEISPAAPFAAEPLEPASPETTLAPEESATAPEVATNNPASTGQPDEQPVEQPIVTLEETDTNPALAEEPTLSTTDLETFAHTGEPPDSARTPHEIEMEKAAKAQVLITKARLEARQGHLETARKLLGQAITEDPNNAEAWTWLGGLLAEVNLERARVCLTRAVELDDTNERTKRGLAEVTRKLEEQARQQEEEAASRAIVLARPEIKIGLEEVMDRQRQSGLEPDPENIPLGGAKFGPAIESGELKPYEYGRPRLGKVPVAIGLIILVGIIVALIWLGPLSRGGSDTPPATVFAGVGGQPGSNLPGGQVQTQVAAASAAQGNAAGSDAAFALRIRLEIDRYNRFFLTAHDLRSQIQSNKITWDKYADATKQLQADIKAEKKPLDNLAVEATPKLIQFYRELQAIAAVTGTAIDFTASGIDNTSPEDLEEGNRQFNDAARRLTDLLGLLNQQMPLTASNLATPAPTLTVPASSGASPVNTPVGTVVLQSMVEPDHNNLTPGPR